MNREKLIAAGIDYDEALERFVSDVPFYEGYLMKFEEDTYFPQLKENMSQKRYEDAFKMAHALKGVVGTLGMMQFHGVVSDLVEALRNMDVELAEEKFLVVEEEYDKMLVALRESCEG